MWCSSISFGGQLLFIIYECGCHLLDSDWDRRIQIIPYNPIDGYWKPVRNLSMVPKRSHKCRCMSWNIPWLMVTGLWIEHKSRVVFISHVLWRNDVHKDLIGVAFLPYDKRIYELTGKCFWLWFLNDWSGFFALLLARLVDCMHSYGVLGLYVQRLYQHFV